VTLSGNVQYAHQKGAAVNAISGMDGVRRVIDQMTVKPAVKRG
jgi:osmotically-inducible protein OsmY